MSRTGELERLDEAVDALATAFIESKPKGAERRFAQLHCRFVLPTVFFLFLGGATLRAAALRDGPR